MPTQKCLGFYIIKHPKHNNGSYPINSTICLVKSPIKYYLSSDLTSQEGGYCYGAVNTLITFIDNKILSTTYKYFQSLK